MILSQTFIKELLAYGLCPRKFKAYFLDQEYRNPPSEYMFRGIYFEYMTLGNLPKEGSVPEYPLNKRGNYEKHKERIDYQIERFPEILKKEQIEIIGGAEEIRFQYSDVLTLSITIDALVLHKGELKVMDTKLTQNLNSRFGPVSWGNYEEMDKLQGHFYSYVLSEVLGVKVGFIYLVFDYKANEPEYALFEVAESDFDRSAMFHRIEMAHRKLYWMRATDYKPIAYGDTCKKCLVKDCIARITVKPRKEEPEREFPNLVPKRKRYEFDLDKLIDFTLK